MTKRALAGIAASLVAVTVPVGGRTLIGFSYQSVDNNEWTVCPDWVVAQTGNVITLTTGEKFAVLDQTAEDITRALLLSNALIKIDRSNMMMLTRRRTLSCGNRPEQNQWLTIPLHAAEVSRPYFAEEFAPIEQLPANDNAAK